MHISWEAFLARYRPMACALAKNWSGRASEVDDLVQEASLALFAAHQRDPGRFESTAHARNYFLRSLRNLAIEARVRAPRAGPIEEDLPGRPDCDPAEEEVMARQRALGRMLRRLEPLERELIARRFLRRETLAQASQAMNVPLSTLHSREKALLSRLRQKLEQEFAKEERE